ncbi:hypothetical protein ACWD0A_32720 [Streptomyces sp. NPDC002867]
MPRERLIHLTLRVVLAGFVVLKSGLSRGGQIRDRGGGPATRGRVDRGALNVVRGGGAPLLDARDGQGLGRWGPGRRLQQARPADAIIPPPRA